MLATELYSNEEMFCAMCSKRRKLNIVGFDPSDLCVCFK